MLSKRLKELREHKKVTQAELADMLGLTQQAVARWERDKSEPDTNNLKILANYFGVSVDYLVGNENKNSRTVSNIDESRLLDGYRELDEPKRQTLFSLLAFLTSKQGTSLSGIVQNNKHGNNFYANGGGNSCNISSAQ